MLRVIPVNESLDILEFQLLLLKKLVFPPCVLVGQEPIVQGDGQTSGLSVPGSFLDTGVSGVSGLPRLSEPRSAFYSGAFPGDSCAP